ncbi:MAG: SDR family NAD(P)-dependent oxidoreductase, partial [Candidatus Puniceispirillaceae bacterium]
MSSLQGKTAFVSGGTRGIGLAIASRLARDGAHVMIAGSTQANCETATKTIAAQAGGRVAAHAADLRTVEGCQAAFDAHSRTFGSCDILVHSAGATKGGVFPDQDDADFIDGFALKFHAGVR